MGTKDHIDTVVPAEKPQSVEADPKRSSHIQHNIVVVNDVHMTDVDEIENVAFTIDEDSYGDGDGDPYNSTGKHCVLKPRKE
jgi:hypothetical protein